QDPGEGRADAGAVPAHGHGLIALHLSVLVREDVTDVFAVEGACDGLDAERFEGESEVVCELSGEIAWGPEPDLIADAKGVQCGGACRQEEAGEDRAEAPPAVQADLWVGELDGEAQAGQVG